MKTGRTPLLGCAVLSMSVGAHAGMITFDEFDAVNTNGLYITNEYRDLGVTWRMLSDGSVWDGLEDGDPGAWGLNGTNGPQFAGFNGGSFFATVFFDDPVTRFSLDAARANGSGERDRMTLRGFRNGQLVELTTVLLEDVNRWRTISLEAEVDEVRIWVRGAQWFRPFGIDNVRWVPTPGALALLAIGGLAVIGRRRRGAV